MPINPDLLQGHRAIDSIDDFQVPERLEERQMVVRYRNKKGEDRCHGGHDLKGSQAYPPAFLDRNLKTLFFPNLVCIVLCTCVILGATSI